MTGPNRAAMDRRRFARLGLCGMAGAVLRARAARGETPASTSLERYGRVLLTGATAEPLRAAALDPEEEYLFFYPFASTPCLLLNLGRPVAGTAVPVREGAAYGWAGGVGPWRSIVAFTAICPHQFAHPEKAFSPIGYHRTGQPATVAGGREALIVCCAHGSAFAPDAGGRLEQGPAEVPLATVVLAWEAAEDRLFAEGVLGPDSFEQFFRNFRGRSRDHIRGEAPVMRLHEYSTTVARC